MEKPPKALRVVYSDGGMTDSADGRFIGAPRSTGRACVIRVRAQYGVEARCYAETGLSEPASWRNPTATFGLTLTRVRRAFTAEAK